jgi:large subunit ribosomal protein L19
VISSAAFFRSLITDHAEGMRPARLERATSGSGGQRSIQLSYGRRKQTGNLAADYTDFHRRDNRTRNACVPIFSLQFHLARMKMFARLAGSVFVKTTARQGKEILMNQIIDAIEKEQQRSDAPQFSVGDSVRVHTRVVEGDKERIQIFAGIVIGRKGRGLNETFTVRRISYGEGVERVFPLHSPRIAKVEVEQQGRVRRARLNYLRTRKGKEAMAVRE